TCGTNSAVCMMTVFDWMLSVNRYDFEDPTEIRFNDVLAVQDEQSPWRFYADFEVAPGVTSVDLSGFATLTYRDILDGGGCVDDMPVCPTGVRDWTFTTVEDPGTSGLWRTIYLYGVEVAYEMPQYFVYTDEYGKSTHDLEIGIVVAPTSYIPEGAKFVLYEQIGGSTEVPVKYLPIAAYAPDRQIDVNGDGVADANVYTVTLQRGESFDYESRYFFQVEFAGKSFALEKNELVVRYIKPDISAHYPGTVEQPGEEVPHYLERMADSLVVEVNSDIDPSTGERDFSDTVIDPLDDDIVKLVLHHLPKSDLPAEAGMMSFSLEPHELFNIYDRDLQPVDSIELLDLSVSPSANLDITAGDVVLYVESLGPTYGARAELSLVGSDDWPIVTEYLLFSSVFREEDYRDAVVASARESLSVSCAEENGCKSRWEILDGTDLDGMAFSFAESESEYWSNTVIQTVGYISPINVIVVKEGKSYSEALEDLYLHPDLYRFECLNPIWVVFYRTIIELLDRCNNSDDYKCLFGINREQGGNGSYSGKQIFDRLYRSKMFSLAAEMNAVDTGFIADIPCVSGEVVNFRAGGWTYLRVPSKEMLDDNDIRQGQNLIGMSNKGCDMCSEDLARYIFNYEEFCPYAPSVNNEGGGSFVECIKDEYFYGHSAGRQTMETWVSLLENGADSYNAENPESFTEPSFPIGVSVLEGRVDLVRLVGRLTQIDWSEQ
ncbi:MAG: hypothetical protein ACXQS5_00215, partial [Candidatus Methanospirareceae archaeon]